MTAPNLFTIALLMTCAFFVGYCVRVLVELFVSSLRDPKTSTPLPITRRPRKDDAVFGGSFHCHQCGETFNFDRERVPLDVWLAQMDEFARRHIGCKPQTTDETAERMARVGEILKANALQLGGNFPNRPKNSEQTDE